MNCTGREGKQLISQVIISPRVLSRVLRSSRSYLSVSSLLFDLLWLITEKTSFARIKTKEPTQKVVHYTGREYPGSTQLAAARVLASLYRLGGAREVEGVVTFRVLPCLVR